MPGAFIKAPVRVWGDLVTNDPWWVEVIKTIVSSPLSTTLSLRSPASLSSEHTYLITFFLVWQLPPTHSHSLLLLFSESISHLLPLPLPPTHTLPWGFSNSLPSNRSPSDVLSIYQSFGAWTCHRLVTRDGFSESSDGKSGNILLSWQSGSLRLRSVCVCESRCCFSWCPHPAFTNRHVCVPIEHLHRVKVFPVVIVRHQLLLIGFGGFYTFLIQHRVIRKDVKMTYKTETTQLWGFQPFFKRVPFKPE